MLEYTGASEIDIIAHSRGVTYSRIIAKGGFVDGIDEPFFVGPPLAPRINTFIGIAGHCWGNPNCLLPEQANFRACSKLDGGYPGSEDAEPYPKDLSKVLLDLNANPIKEGKHTFSILSLYDRAYTYSRLSCEWPTMDASFKYNSSVYDHLGTRDLSVEI